MAICLLLFALATSLSKEGRKFYSQRQTKEKHEGKWICREEGVPFVHLKKGQTFLKSNYKHTKNTKLWAAKKHANIVAD